MKNLNYTELLKRNTQLSKSLRNKKYSVHVLSNIITAQLHEILEYTLRIDGIPAEVQSGDYNNIVQDSEKFRDSNLVIIFWELCNLVDGMQYEADLMNDAEVGAIFEKTTAEIALTLKNLTKTSLVLFNRFTALPFTNNAIHKTRLEELAECVNQYLTEIVSANANVRIVDVDKIIALVGSESSIDLRNYYSSKAFYTVKFFKAYSDYVKPFIFSANGKAKKALIFDCDDTLWKGILGEDGFDKIEMSPFTKDGSIFAEIQSLALSLNKQGVLLGLCSKNNPADVDQVLSEHPDMQIRDEHLTIKKVNWNDKVSNLCEIARELNIGLDSLVFVDDSDFEVNLVREQLLEVKVLQVSKRLYEYPNLIRENMGLFYELSKTAEDKKKITMYKEQLERKSARKAFENLGDYLASLDIEMTVFEDDKSIIPRMAQMSQKTNQFNLTTKRYTEGDITRFVEDDDIEVMAISVSDKYGNSGVTGLCIVNTDAVKKAAEIDTFFMSCRIIGRSIEYAFIDHVIHKLKNEGIEKVLARYCKTRKNEQVKEFYDSCGFTLLDSCDSKRSYDLYLDNYKPKEIKHIEIVNGKPD
nr:HAD-IIIC family phosphatase [Bacteroidota bacterium]